MTVFCLGSTAIFRASAGLIMTRKTGTRLFPAHKLMQTQLYKSNLLANVFSVYVYKGQGEDESRSVKSKTSDTGRNGRSQEIN